MTDYLPGYDAWLSREPEYAEEPLPEEDELPEPTVEEVWDGGRGEYVHVVTAASGAKYTIVQEREGAYAGEYCIHGSDGSYRDGYSSPEKAIDWIIDMVLSVSFLAETPPPEPRWETFFAGCAGFTIGIGIIIGAIIGVQALAPEIAELEVAVGQRATAVWQWVVTFGHCPACCGSGI